MSTTVHVQGISSSTSQKEIQDFFSFCGKITTLEVSGSDPKTATVTFEKETAAKTALLLDNTNLGGSTVHVTASGDVGNAAPTQTTATHEDDLTQEDKPRSRILAEYLAHGYQVSDQTIEKALALDKQHGVSNRFTTYLQNWDEKLKASERAKSIDAKYDLSTKANTTWAGLTSYLEKGLSTPTGQKIHHFYMQGQKQVLDVHNEARRLADLKAGKNAPESVPGTDKTVCKCGSESGKCPCPPGQCACTNCAKADPAATQEVKEAAGEHAADATPAKA